MASKPEDIPQDVWDTATETARTWYHEEWDEASLIQYALVEGIARALVAERNAFKGSLADSMTTVVELADRAALAALINADGWQVEDGPHVQPYGYDDRIGWDTHLVTVMVGSTWVVAGMTDGPLA